ncbi:MAG: serine/threonine protein phosphatase [Lachnospiraceae bacterium]|nr:serine/threonine protein phosphatase [Lachnospiraceae bacterium]
MNNKQKLLQQTKNFIEKYKHAWVLLYVLIYFPWFAYLEKHVTTHFNVIHMSIDDKIPFIEFFIIPYLLWFAYVAGAVLHFFFKNKQDYYKLCAFLFVGMTVFLVISTIYPNGHYLRPHYFERDNIFTHMVGWLYSTDTATNLFPSIHVYNSLGVHFAIMHSDEFKQNKAVRIGSFVLMTSIILSTMFLKQHSVFDVITAFVMAAVMYTFVYGRSVVLEHQKAPEKSWHNI